MLGLTRISHGFRSDSICNVVAGFSPRSAAACGHSVPKAVEAEKIRWYLRPMIVLAGSHVPPPHQPSEPSLGSHRFCHVPYSADGFNEEPMDGSSQFLGVPSRFGTALTGDRCRQTGTGGTEWHYSGRKFKSLNAWNFCPKPSLFHHVDTTIGEKRSRQVVQGARALCTIAIWQSYCVAEWMFM